MVQLLKSIISLGLIKKKYKYWCMGHIKWRLPMCNAILLSFLFGISSLSQPLGNKAATPSQLTDGIKAQTAVCAHVFYIAEFVLWSFWLWTTLQSLTVTKWALREKRFFPFIFLSFALKYGNEKYYCCIPSHLLNLKTGNSECVTWVCLLFAE